MQESEFCYGQCVQQIQDALKTMVMTGHVRMQIVGAKACNLCIVSGGCSRPANLSTDITAVREEWLLKGAEKYKLESERVHAVK